VPDEPTALINTSVGLRREVATKALKVIGGMEGVGVITCHQPGAIKSDAYRTLVATVNAELSQRGDWALMIGDGAPHNPDPHVQRAATMVARMTTTRTARTHSCYPKRCENAGSRSSASLVSRI